MLGQGKQRLLKAVQSPPQKFPEELVPNFCVGEEKKAHIMFKSIEIVRTETLPGSGLKLNLIIILGNYILLVMIKTFKYGIFNSYTRTNKLMKIFYQKFINCTN